MKLNDFFLQFNLDNSLLIGYYGGGNYGDELLLEILINLMDARHLRNITITYQNPANYHIFHHDFGYKRINMHDARSMFYAILSNKNIVIGGGGLWGLDVNPNILRLGLLLFISKWVFRKRVYLLGVGYYNSTSKLGHVGAWLAGKSARYIMARDQESYENFRKISKHVSLDTDMAWHIPKLELTHYDNDISELEQRVPIQHKTIFITLRRFKGDRGKVYLERITKCLEQNRDKAFIAAILEPKGVDPENHARLEVWQKSNQNIHIMDFAFNPLALALYFKKHSQQLAVIGPQFHLILSAHLAHIPFFPIAYDNKVSQLLSQIGCAETIPITSIPDDAVQKFIDNFYEDG